MVGIKKIIKRGLFLMSRVYNFSAGPAVLPEEVLKEAAEEMLDYQGTGMSVMEMSHRSKAFEGIIQGAEKTLRELMNIPDNYKVLFLQGGASQQFAMIPMNLMKNKVADHIVTGQWAKKAASEAKIFGKVNILASSEDKTFSYIPDMKDKIDPYLQPLYDALQDMIPAAKLKEYMELNVIQIAPLAFMRGRTLSDAVVILDEAQNTTTMQIKMFLTRMGLIPK